MTKAEQEAGIAALLEERRGYVLRGMDDRVREVDAQLRALGAQAEKKSGRAEKRPAASRASKR